MSQVLDLKPCPNRQCHGADTNDFPFALHIGFGAYQIKCPACLTRGPESYSIFGATRAWNEDLSRAEPIANSQRAREEALEVKGCPR